MLCNNSLLWLINIKFFYLTMHVFTFLQPCLKTWSNRKFMVKVSCAGKGKVGLELQGPTWPLLNFRSHNMKQPGASLYNLLLCPAWVASPLLRIHTRPQLFKQWLTLSSGYNVLVGVHFIRWVTIYPLGRVICSLNTWGRDKVAACKSITTTPPPPPPDRIPVQYRMPSRC